MLNTSDYFWFMLGACSFGFGMGGIVPMQGAVVGAPLARFIWTRHGRDALTDVSDSSGRTPFAGWVFDTTGSYDWAFYTFLALYCWRPWPSSA